MWKYNNRDGFRTKMEEFTNAEIETFKPLNLTSEVQENIIL